MAQNKALRILGGYDNNTKTGQLNSDNETPMLKKYIKTLDQNDSVCNSRHTYIRELAPTARRINQGLKDPFNDFLNKYYGSV